MLNKCHLSIIVNQIMIRYLGKDIYHLLLKEKFDPSDSVTCFRIKFFYDLLIQEERNKICYNATLKYMSERQISLYKTYLEQMNLPIITIKGLGGKDQPENYINCWVCQKKVHKNSMVGHIIHKHYHMIKMSQFNLPTICIICACPYPGGTGPHPLTLNEGDKVRYIDCPLKIIDCPNRYNIIENYNHLTLFPKEDRNLHLDYSKYTGICFFTGPRLQVEKHLKTCKWTCKHCKQELAGDHKEHLSKDCPEYNEVYIYHDNQTDVLLRDFHFNKKGSSLHFWKAALMRKLQQLIINLSKGFT